MTPIEFTNTKAYRIIKEFIFQIDNSLKTETQQPMPNDYTIHAISDLVKSTPLSSEKGRYANPAMAKVIEEIENVTTDVYLRNSFGNRTRMDFGTGHELNFLCYLYKQVVHKKLQINQVSSILSEYFRIVRMYIAKFNVEAAGSRGCWSIDDYLLLPYLFGSSENFQKLETIDVIQSGIFKEAYTTNVSPALKNLCRGTWKAINMELLAMYDEQVLRKRVVTQHFIYSDELPMEKGTS